MTHPPYLREKARKLRVERKLSLDEIAERLALNRTTVWHWIKDLPDPEIKYRDSEGRKTGRARAAEANRQRAQAARDRAYRIGWEEFPVLESRPAFRDFVNLYIGEGSKRSRNRVALGNSNPLVMRLANFWICEFAVNKVTYAFQYHADQDPEALTRFWSGYLGVDPAAFSVQRKSNSGQLAGRTWRSQWGVLTVRTADTQFRARLQAWMDRVQDSWLDSVPRDSGV